MDDPDCHGTLRRRHVLALLASIGVWPSAGAQTSAPYPNRAIRFIVPYTVGGATDVLARTAADSMAKSLNQSIVIENRAGAGVVLASSFVASAPPDGYTLLVTTSAHSINQTLFRKLPYDSDKDFEPVAMIGKVSFVLLVNAKSDVKDFRSLLDMLKKDPGKYNFGSAGLGSPMHVGPELLKILTSTQATHIPYKGESAAINDLLAGNTTFMYASPSIAASHIKAGTLRALAVTSPRRSVKLPEVPTLLEAGYPGAETYSWVVLMAPANTPKPIIEKINGEVMKALATPEVKARMADFDFDTEARLSPAETGEFIRSEAAKWAPIVKASGAVVD